MIGLQRIIVVSTLVLGALSSSRHTAQEDESIVDWNALQSVLDKIDSSALHSVLHSLSPKFKDGVFSKDRSAIEHVHSESPAVASKLVHLAWKRQNSNSTTTKTPDQSTRDSSISAILSTKITASTVPGETTVTVAPTAPPSAVAIATENGAVVYSTIGGGLITLTSSAVNVRFTPSTSTHLYYETAANGDVQTSTSVVVVNAPVTGTDDAGSGAAATSGSNPSLQDSGVSLQISGLLMTMAACVAAGMLMI